jgi:hypothetical protein
MTHHNLAMLIILTPAVMVIVKLWRKVLLLMLSLAIAVFLVGLIYVVQLIHV